MTTVLLTGATGLVGSRLLPRLVEAGFDCRALVRRDIALPAGATGVRGDLDDPGSLREAVEGVEAVVHLAALFRTGDEDAIWRANRDGTRHLIDAVKTYAPQARFVMASTGNVYDADALRPGREDDAATPTAAYPASKLAAEALLRDERPDLVDPAPAVRLRRRRRAPRDRCPRWPRASACIPPTPTPSRTTATSRSPSASR